MDFRISIPFSKQDHNQIDYHSEIVFFGSCFAENMADKINYYKFRQTSNPFGILYHPLALENLITRSINNTLFTKNDCLEVNDRWISLETHSRLSAQTADELIERLNSALLKTQQGLLNASHVVITLGTSWVYRHISSDRLVANCHKIPQKAFLKELLGVDKIRESLDALINLIKQVNDGVVLIFTVSPVRHIRDGIIENARSKANLISAIHELIEPRKKIHYFPAYEIMMDELRDYRFYADDMIHPSRMAIHYIWEKFSSVWLKPETTGIMKEVDAIQKALAHKPFQPESKSHLMFKEELDSRITKLKQRYDFISFE
ncbi:MAG: GSCFA domain-containing protein [Bacteroidia bacterium]|nr:GSCFA domain-containing protein [Bacteroidia bacterium]